MKENEPGAVPPTAWNGSGALSKPRSQDPSDEKVLKTVSYRLDSKFQSWDKTVPSYNLGDV